MENFEENACMNSFYALCEELASNELVSEDECQYWVFELGYRSTKGSLAEFGQLCDMANSSELVSMIDCQYWLFERGHLAAKECLTNTSEFEQLDMAQYASFGQKSDRLIYIEA